MRARFALRASAVAGLTSAALILAGSFLSSRDVPSMKADSASWRLWAEENEGAIETGVYTLLVPGLLLLLVLMAALLSLQQRSVETYLSSWGVMGFVICMAVSGVLSSNTASTLGFFDEFEDPEALTVFTGVSAGFHLTIVAVWSFAMAMAATTYGLGKAGRISSRLRAAGLVLAGVTAAAGYVGAGVVPALVWVVSASLILLKIAPSVAPVGAAPT